MNQEKRVTQNSKMKHQIIKLYNKEVELATLYEDNILGLFNIKVYGIANTADKIILELSNDKGVAVFPYAFESPICIDSKSINNIISELFLDAEYFSTNILAKLIRLVPLDYFYDIQKIGDPSSYSKMRIKE